MGVRACVCEYAREGHVLPKILLICMTRPRIQGRERSALPSIVVATVKPRYNAVSGRHILRPRYKRGAL